MEKRAVRLNEKTKGLVALIVVAVLIASLITATLILSGAGGADTEGEITPENLGNIRIVYTPETEQAFIALFRRYFIKLLDGLDPESIDISFMRIVLLALQDAGITADKAISLATYYAERDLGEEPLKDILAEFLKPLLDEQGNPVINPETGKPIYEFNAAADPLVIFTSKIDFVKEINDLVLYSGITPDEAGAFLFNYLMLTASPEKTALLRQLGKENFTLLFIDTAVIYSEISQTINKGGVTLAEGRMARELLYELGARYIRIAESFGAENLEKLLGIGLPLLDESVFPEDMPGLDSIVYINNAFTALKGLTGYALHLAGGILTSIDAAAADAAVRYQNGGNEKHLFFAALLMFKTSIQAHDSALIKSGVSEQAVIDGLAVFMANMRVINTENNVTVAIAEEKARLQSFIAEIRALTGDAKYAAINTPDAFFALPESDYSDLKARIDGFVYDGQDIVSGLEKAQTLIVYALLFSSMKNYVS